MEYTVKVKKLHEDAILPNIAKLGDAGADLFSVEETIIQPGQTVIVKTGIAIELPEGTEGWGNGSVQERHPSGRSWKW